MAHTPDHRLAQKRIVLGVTGSIAAFKAATLCGLFRKEGANVRVVLTPAATRFVGSATFAGLSGQRVLDDMFDQTEAGELHIQLGTESDLIVVAPATADFIARTAMGRTNDLLSATVLCARCPVVIAPAMHPAMWMHPATQRNVADLAVAGRVRVVGPVVGEVATGEIGQGRMSEPEAILEAAVVATTPHDLRGRHIVISAGPTVEDLDPVRFLTNRSSGKMGFALAWRAACRGARVSLVTGPVALPTPTGVERIDVRSALSMQAALNSLVYSQDGAPLADAVIMSSAVGDYRPRTAPKTKMKRGPDEVSLDLIQNPDILAELGARRQTDRPTLIGFAVETGDDAYLVSSAQSKLSSKRVDMVVANSAEEGFGGDSNRAVLVTAASAPRALPRCSKERLADEILEWLARRWAEGDQ